MQAAPVPVIARHAIGHDHAGIIVEMRVPHSQRSKNVRIGESAERLSADPLHDASQQVVRAVVVLEFGAGREVESPCARQNSQNRFVRIAAILARRSQPLQHERVAQAAGVGQEVADRDAAPVIGPFGDVLLNLVVQR